MSEAVIETQSQLTPSFRLLRGKVWLHSWIYPMAIKFYTPCLNTMDEGVSQKIITKIIIAVEHKKIQKKIYY